MKRRYKVHTGTKIIEREYNYIPFRYITAVFITIMEIAAILADTWLSLLLSAIGTIVMITAYPTYKYVSDKTKSALTPEILRLSEEILNL